MIKFLCIKDIDNLLVKENNNITVPRRRLDYPPPVQKEKKKNVYYWDKVKELWSKKK